MRNYLYSSELNEEYELVPDRIFFYKWLFLLIFGDYIFPLFFDPFSIFGFNFILDTIVDYEDVYFILIVFIFPYFLFYYYETEGFYAYLIALLFYIFVLKWMLHILYYSFIYDFIYFLLFLMVLVDLLLMDDEEEIGEEDFI